VNLEIENEILGRQTAAHMALKSLIAVLPAELAAAARVQFENQVQEVTHGPDADQPVNVVVARELQKFATLAQR